LLGFWGFKLISDADEVAERCERTGEVWGKVSFVHSGCNMKWANAQEI